MPESPGANKLDNLKYRYRISTTPVAFFRIRGINSEPRNIKHSVCGGRNQNGIFKVLPEQSLNSSFRNN